VEHYSSVTIDTPAPRSDEVVVWTIRLDGERPSSRDLLRGLSKSEKERASQFQFTDAQRRFVVARAAMRAILGGYLAVRSERVELVGDDREKPRLADIHAAGDLCFNLAHSGELALLAVARGVEVGVDVERQRPIDRVEQIARRYFHPREAVEIMAEPADERAAAFLRCWTGKEAVLKAIGLGMSVALDRFHVPHKGHSGTWIEINESTFSSANASGPPSAAKPRLWLVPLAPYPGYIAAVATLGERRTVTSLPFPRRPDQKGPAM
jgi:4'-phosphopantetheinyl transferase